MAQYGVTHTCGHSEWHDLIGPGKDRERKLSWLETTVCSECYKAQKEAEKTAANEYAKTANAETGLPELTGTEKQIAWAETIRLKIATDMSDLVSRIDNAVRGTDELKQLALRGAATIMRQTKATYWINNKDNTARQILNKWVEKRMAEQKEAEYPAA